MDNARSKEDLINIEKSIKHFKILAIVLILLGIACIPIIFYQNNYVHPMQWNEVGDFLGGTMVGIWSLAGLIFIYVAFLGQKQQMIYQQQELDLNRTEIKQTNKTLKLQRKEMSKQNETAKRQQFENLLFNMIDTHLKIVEDLDTVFTTSHVNILHNKEIPSQGRDVFMNAYNVYISEEKNGDDRIKAYQNLFESKNAEFSHYYRFLYRIISKIDRQQFISKNVFDPNGNPEKEYVLYNYEIKYEYTSIVRSLLSDEELQLLFYNMLLFKDLKFKKLIEKYCLLKNIPGGQEKIDDLFYGFDPGAIQKKHNNYLKELYQLKQE